MSASGGVKDKLLHSRGFFMYVRSTIASQIASWIDMGVSFMLFALFGLFPWLSTALGALTGGVVNCCINYKFTFRATGCSVKAVALKYAIVWVGSLVLNTLGTQGAFWVLENVKFIQELHLTADGSFAIARLSVSLIVSIFWNYLLQKKFVYTQGKFDPTAEKILDSAAEVIFFHHLRKKNGKRRENN